MTVDAEILDPDWVFESSIAHPDGFRVTVAVTVPQRLAWKDIGEVAELAQMAASSAATRIATSRTRSLDEEPPF